MLTPTDAFPVILGDTDTAGNTSATFVHQWGKFRVKLQSQIQSTFNFSQYFIGGVWCMSCFAAVRLEMAFVLLVFIIIYH